jgi:hypothetical protein
MKELWNFAMTKKGEARVDELFESVVRLISGKNRREDEGFKEEEKFPKGKWGC